MLHCKDNQLLKIEGKQFIDGLKKKTHAIELIKPILKEFVNNSLIEKNIVKFNYNP